MLTGLAGVCTLQARARDFEILVSSDSLGASSLGWAALALVTTGTAAVQGLGPHTATCAAAAGWRAINHQPWTQISSKLSRNQSSRILNTPHLNLLSRVL